jgi:hypothetical protein
MDGMNRLGKPAGEEPTEPPASDPASARGSAARVIDIDDTMVGRRFLQFEVRARLGISGVSVAYLAEDTSLKQPVVLKVLRRTQAPTESQVAETLSAARQQARVAHQHVAQVRFVGVTDGLPFVVTEHVDGITLREELKRNGAMPWTEAVAVLFPIARALQAAQSVGLTHGSLTSSNVIVRRPEGAAPIEVKVDGFGVRTMNDVDGDSPYAAPEQRAGGLPSVRADMYALGALLHEMVTAAPPHADGRGISERLAPGYVRRLAAFLMRTDPKQRPSGYDELLGRLEVALIEPPAARPFLTRAAAFAIDLLVMTVVIVGMGVLLPRMMPTTRWEAMQFGLLAFVIYSVLAHHHGGQTVGKQICGVMALRPRQGSTWKRMLARVLIQLWGPLTAALVIDIELGFSATLPEIGSQLGGVLGVLAALWLAGFVVVLTDRKGTALHDHVTGTSVTFG